MFLLKKGILINVVYALGKALVAFLRFFIVQNYLK